MNGDNETATSASFGEAKQKRQRSKISFPYTDLDSAIELAKAIHGNVGRGDCDDDQLAAWTNQSAKSSTFRVQVYAARTFGILESEGSKHKLSNLGRQIVDPNHERKAKADAFLTVPLFNAVYSKYKGGVVPPTAALEREMVELGVSEKQKSRARTALERSAKSAGFFEHGGNRLVMPGMRDGGDPASAPTEDEQKNGSGNGGVGDQGSSGTGGGNGGGYHPFIEGLLQTLPEPGTLWTIEGRAAWLRAAATNFTLIYKGEGEISVTSQCGKRDSSES